MMAILLFCRQLTHYLAMHIYLGLSPCIGDFRHFDYDISIELLLSLFWLTNKPVKMATCAYFELFFCRRLEFYISTFLLGYGHFKQPVFALYGFHRSPTTTQQLLSIGGSIYRMTCITEYHVQSLDINMVHSLLQELSKSTSTICTYLNVIFK